MADPTVRGRFVWHELLTPDPAAAQAFYTGICGWRVESWDQDPNYAMFVGPHGPLSGILQLPGNALGTGEQPKWLPYIATEDVDATVARAESLGGRVLQQSGATPGGGRYAVLADPQGACFGVYGSTTASTPAAQTVARGEFSWHELATTDHEAAFAFYSELFGWKQLGTHDMGAKGVYRIFGIDGVRLGGMFNKTAEMRGEPAWLSYVLVANAGKSADKIREAGAQIVNGPMEAPGGDWIAVAADPQGAMFAVHAYKSKAKTKTRAAAAVAQSPAESASTVAAESESQGEPARAKPKKKETRAAAKPRAAAERAAKKAAKQSAKKARKKATERVGKKAAKKKSTRRSAVRGKQVARRAAAKNSGRKVKRAPAKKVKRAKARRGK
jgi:predicted enzyme related to lactoylglutathione lyase